MEKPSVAKQERLTPERVRELGVRLKAILELNGSPVGVRLLFEEQERPAGAHPVTHHRYCQAVMKARHGDHVTLDKEGLSCPAASAAFGFKPLPAQLRSGKGLVGFGIVADPDVGKTIFDHMPHLEPGTLKLLDVFPLDKAEAVPDIVVVEDTIERLMWLTLAYLHATGGERVSGTTAVLQAVCADSTIIPYLEQRLNFGYGCYGCREATDIGPNETVVGFPISFLPPIVEQLEFLNQKAIPVSRSKRALKALQKADQQPEKSSSDE
ncbi:MAG: DUF169 domain-containing protein [Nitrospira sp.]|nr:DUF169 domain-containing protein [Nitrospira sp.]MCP9443610.1 DUF169 domain-containing protein [Nitrospira sp.]